jgi:uncharacterized membrane protein
MEVKEKNKKQALLAASVAGLLAIAGSISLPATAQAEEVPCYGINACKGTGDCGGKNHSCAGANSCKGEAYIKMEKDLCLRIQNGSLTPKAS